jgi:hypothetical protein
MKQTNILLVFFVLICILPSLAVDKVVYEYDMAGNRTARRIITLQQAKRHQPTDSVVIKESIGQRSIKVFPNPTRGALGIDIQGGDPKQVLRLVIYSGAGATLYNQPATEGLNPIDMTQYPQGWYVLRVVAGTEKREYKIVKE